MICRRILIIFFILIPLLVSAREGVVTPTALECEGLTNPEGIDVKEPRLSWKLQSSKTEIVQIAYQILVASSPEKLADNEADLWDSGKVIDTQSINIIYKGKRMNSGEEAFWKVKVWSNKGETDWSEKGFWSIGIMNYAEWKSTRWIGLDKAFPWDSIKQFSRLSARYLRKEFEPAKPVARAKVYIMGLGLYELYINGHKIGDQVLAPVPTDYTKNVKYNVFDVTKELNPGKNAIGTILGNGRYFTMRQNYKPYKIKTFGFPKMAMQLVLQYVDGSQEVVRTDTGWKITADGPILTNNEYDGEEYDARKEMPGWNKPGFNDADWLEATYVQEPRGAFEAQMTPNMRIMEEIKPLSIKKRGDAYLLDMGQNLAGWLQMKVQGEKGDVVTLKFAETIQADGSLFRSNLRDAKVTDKYTLKGGGIEVWEPTFVYHGFRYVEISGYPGKPSLDDFTGKVVYDNMETTGTFECSDPVMNQVFKNAYWGIRSNYKGMPVDCPQRNERQPWLGDRTTGAHGESFLFDNATLYAKWLDDIRNAQTQDGGIPDVAPAFWRYYGDNVTWPGTYITVADMLYTQYGDKRSVIRHYPSMKKWMTYMEANYLKDDLITKDKYGDWCVPPESLELIHSKDPARQTDGTLIASAYYVHLLDLMSKFAALEDDYQQDIPYFQNLAKRIKIAFNARFLDQSSYNYDNGTVTANVLAIAFNIAPLSIQEKIFKNIVQAITVTYHNHISTGVIGTQYLMRTLTKFGRADLAYTLASNNTYPSWGYMAENGATTIWELWNGNTADPAMNSQNHVMLLGDLMIWYFENVAGIKTSPEQVGFDHIIIKPSFIENLDFVNASYNAVKGKITSNWKRKKNKLEWKVVIPANAAASLYLPKNAEKISINNRKPSDSQAVTRSDSGVMMINLRSGSYQIELQL